MQVNVINDNNVEVTIDPPETIVVEVDQGKAGRGIASISYQQVGANYYLLITYTDGTTQQVGPLTNTGTATSLLGGTAGAIAYQTAPDTTGFLTLGTQNNVLVAGATAPQYTSSLTGLTINSTLIGQTTRAAGAFTNLDADYLQLNTAAAASIAVAKLRWNVDTATAAFGIIDGTEEVNIGQQMYALVTNAEATSITRGQPVYLYQATGNRASVKLASNLGDATSAKTFGLVAQTIAAGGVGFVLTQGVLDKVDTSAFPEGTTLYLGATAGTLTGTKPQAPNHLVYIGVVERSNAGNGQIYVRVQNGYELNEIHDVQINSPANGQTIIYDASTSLWKNANLTAGTGISITNGPSSITISAPETGTVTSVDASGGTTGLTFSGGPITSSGTLTLAGTLNAANGGTGATTLTGYVYGNGTGAMTAATTIPGSAITGNISGNAANVTGTVAVANGGTGATTAPNALTNLGAAASAITISAGTGLSGGGDLSANRTISIANTGVTAASYGSASDTLTATVNAQGQLTALAATPIAIANTQVSGLGTMSTQNANSVSITGGSITGITDLAVADGGTGASDAPTARTNLGAAASATTISAGTGLTGGGDLSANRTLSIANTGVTAASYGSASNTLTATVNAQGQLTALAATPIAIANTQVSGLGTMSTQDANNVAITGGSIAVTSGSVSNTPTTGNDIANKTYVDTLVSSGITYHTPVKYEVPSTTGNLTATYNNGTAGVGATLTNAGTLTAFTPDGVVAQAGDRILIYNQTNAAENGVYTVTTVGSGSVAWVLTRATDANSYGLKTPNALGEGDAFFVSSGNTGAGETYVCNTSGTITFGTTPITFAQVSASQVYSAGTGLTLSGTQFSITNTAVTAGSYGSASSVGTFTVNGQGQLTAAATTPIAITNTQVSGLGTMSTQNASNVAITGGSITGITDLAIADGGTGASTAAGARTNLAVPGLADANTFTNTNVIDVNSSSAALRITQTGAGNALLVEDSANPDASPFVVDASGNVIVGRTTTTNLYPTAISPVQIVTGQAINRAAAGPQQNFYRVNTSFDAPSIVASGDRLGVVQFSGFDGANAIIAAQIESLVDGTPGTNDMPGRLVFSTTADGASSPTERMRIDNDGRIGIGGAQSIDGINATIYNKRVITGGTSASGHYTNAVVQSGVTNGATYFETAAQTQAASFTLGALTHFSAVQGSFGAGSTVINQYGFRVSSSFAGATNNFGFYSDIASGTGRWNFYANGTAANVFAGTTHIGGVVGSESLRVIPTASAVNWVQVYGSITTGAVTIEAAGSDTNIWTNYRTKGSGVHQFISGGGLQFQIGHAASAVNNLFVRGSATGVAPALLSTGSDADVGILMGSKGAGAYQFATNGGVTEQFRIAHTASAVNYLQATGSATGNAPTLSAQGSDTNINLNLTPKGTGVVQVNGNINVSGLTASKGVFTDASKNLTSTGTLGLDQGGTGATTQAGAANAILPTQTGNSGKYLTTNGTDVSWATVSSSGTVTSVDASGGTTGLTFTGGPITTSGTLTLGGTLGTANGGTGLTSFTANGLVYASSTSALTTGSALTFDGTNLAVGTGKVTTSTAGASAGFQWGGTTTTSRLYDDGAGSAYLDIGAGASNASVPLFVRTKGSGGTIYFQPAGTNAYVFDTSNQIWSIGGTESMRLTSTGLGIGTSSPQKKLVVSDAGAVGMEWSPTDDPGSMRQLAYNRSTSAYVPLRTEASQHEFYIGGTEGMRLDSAGNLGLGVTPSAWGGGGKAFDITSTGSFEAIGGNSTSFSYNRYFNGTSNIYKTTGFASIYSQNSSGQHIWYTAPSGTAGNAISFTQAMTLDASGNLLVGKTASSFSNAGRSAFEISGSTDSIIALQYGSANSFYLQVNSTAGYLWNAANTPVVFATNNTERARISNTGIISLGAAPGAESLRVNPIASAVNYFSLYGAATGNSLGFYAEGSDTNIGVNYVSKGTGAHFFYSATSAPQFRISHTASAVNYVQATGGATGNAPILSAQGTDTNIDLSFAAKNTGAINFYANANDIGFKISSNGTTGNSWIAYGSSVSPILEASGASTNVNGIFRTKGSGVMAFRTNLVDEQLRIVHTASAVNYLQVTGGATGNAPTIFATGSDTNISLQYGSKGTGAHIFYTRGTTSNIQFNVSDVASAVNYWNIYGAATTGYPTLQVLGSDTNIGFVVAAKGTGPGVFQSASTQFQNTSGQVQFLVASAASAVNYVQASGSATGVDVALAAAGSDTNINLNLISKGTGVVEANGIPVVTTTGTQTLTNKRVTPRVSTTTSSATPTINTDNVDQFGLTAQAVDITSFTTNLSGTPTDGQKLWIYIVGTAARAITWGASFEASTIPLPTTTVSTNRLDVGFVWNAATSKWRCVATA